MPEPVHHDYHAFGLPFSLRGNMADSEMGSVGSPGRFNRGNLADLDMASVGSPRRFSRGNLADSAMASLSSSGRYSRGNLADSEMASASSPGRYNATERYYDDGFSRAYDMSPLQGMAREMQYSSLDNTYTTNGGLSDMGASKPWLYGHSPSSSPSASLGSAGTNGFLPQQQHQMGDYSNLASGVNGYRRQANGRW